MLTAESIARALGRARKIERDWISSCPVAAHGKGRGDQNPSFSIIDGDDRVLVHCHAGCSQEEVIGSLKARGLWSSNDEGGLVGPIPHSSCASSPTFSSGGGSSRYCQQLWDQSEAAQGTLAEKYLGCRGLTGPIPPMIRYLPNHNHDNGDQYPVMLGGVSVYPDNKICGVHRTFLDPRGTGKAEISPNRKMLGQIKGGAVQLAIPDQRLAIAEGIETALSVQQATGIPTWAALSTGGVEGLVIPEPSILKDVLICADNDIPGRAAASTAAEKWVDIGHSVQIAYPPPGQDFNDLLTDKPKPSKVNNK